ncbi:ELMO domain [Dillenia turbinata]|uniref:ELMO domain n=1 Tax=Dillenia turbinata TaxID=194707 RepID=A0AAN8W671_9MAGN
MTSGTLRRRLHHGDIDGRRRENLETSELDGLNEPLLQNRDCDDDRRSESYCGMCVGMHGWRSLGRGKKEGWSSLDVSLFSLDCAMGTMVRYSGLCKRGIQHLYGSISVLAQNKYYYLLNTEFARPWSILVQEVYRIIGAVPSSARSVFWAVGVGRSRAVSVLVFQEVRLENLRRRLEIPFDGSSVEHQDFRINFKDRLKGIMTIVVQAGAHRLRLWCWMQYRVAESRKQNVTQSLVQKDEHSCVTDILAKDALKWLWKLAYPNMDLPSLKSELWKDMGWQGSDPSTDFRGGGYISLENLIYFAENYPDSFQSLLHKRDGERAEWEYPFAVAGINISFMLAQMLDLQSGKPASLVGRRFLELLGEDEMAFDILYCVAFRMMDAQWLAKRASYMDFNDVLKSTRSQLERELALEDVSSVKDLPAYNLLRR